ncbi:MFS transporter [Flammeovirga yaeyamensis]|uniref:MFS transporter n=2 Tax=Flammeovirga yaeyamensis TaxID=367791 RepID=A0AAX1N604_9BACT|nr:MFS transporter [Flammeovirga yaeyamensis]MBB3697478.1 GPH family glycoside/pentoside/hexuronide:cation symporter [Flammeovirga yaeyamensis]NMF36172.1 MFS transporter [Flammeovirga yaeyamensis]QWG02905.1 MFS transporter [Flammeovirga yaeyamensis]
MQSKLTIKEKIGYALGDGAANIAWRGVATFLLIFYTDVFGFAPAVVGVLMLVARFSDGISDILMGVVGDRTKSKYGKFRPWILWTAFPLGIILALLFTTPDLSENGKLIYAYVTYILFTLIYTANNIPYGALMAVMTGDDRERTSIGSFRMVGAFAGGMIVQGALLYLVMSFGSINPEMQLVRLSDETYKLNIVSTETVENALLKTEDGIAQFKLADKKDDIPTESKSFSMVEGEEYHLIVYGVKNLGKEDVILINQKKGYSYSIYVMSLFLSLFMLITFASTKERVVPDKKQKTNLKQDLKDLIHNKPWLVLLSIGLLFNIYNSIKQGIVVIYFTHFLKDQLLASSYMVGLTLASIVGAMITSFLSDRFGKKKLFIAALIISGIVNALIYFCTKTDVIGIFILGIISELAAAIFPTLFFTMLGDAADYSEYKNGRRATGLVYSAGSFATKFGGGIAASIIGIVLGMYHYDGQNQVAIEEAVPGIIMLMSWVPAVIALIAALLMVYYPLNDQKLREITLELQEKRNGIDRSEMLEDKAII